MSGGRATAERSLWALAALAFGGSLGPTTGLEAINRFGPTPTLTAVAVVLPVTVPLVMALRRREQRA